MKKMMLMIAILGVGTSAMALNLAEKKQKAEWEASLKEKESYFKTQCGYVAPASFEEAMVPSFAKENAGLDGFCDNIRSTVAGMCSDATAKAEIAKKIKKFHCKLGKADKVELKLSGTTMEATFTAKSPDATEEIKTFVNNNL